MIKQYTDGAWVTVDKYKVYKSQEVESALPLTMLGNGEPLTSCKLYGNTVQNSIPTPADPIYPNGAGEETDNLFDINTVVLGKYIDANGVEQTSTGTEINKLNHTDYINILPNTDYTFTYSSTAIPNINTVALCWYNSQKQLISRTTKNVSGNSYYINGTSPSTAVYCIINFIGYYETSVYQFIESGTTKTYYKIPVNVQSGNLLDFNALKNAPAGMITNYSLPHVLELQLKPNTAYTMVSNGTGNETASPADSYRSVYFNSSQTPSTVFKNHPVTVTTDSTGMVKIGIFTERTNAQQYLDGTAQVWLVESSIPLPYQPYSRTTTNIYLGLVVSTRRIKKLVLTGEEDWELQSINSYGVANYRLSLTGRYSDVDLIMSTHYVKQTTPLAGTRTAGIYNYGNPYFYIRDVDTDSVTSFKTFLAGQYTNGTPVCVYYVLREPETAVVNEPLMKIGDYADEVSVTGLPTIDGVTVYDCDLEVKPSKMEAEADARWLPYTPKKYTNGEWR